MGGVSITQLRGGVLNAASELVPGLGGAAPATVGHVTTPSGRVARVLANPSLPHSRPDAAWTTPAGARLFGSSGLPTTLDIDKGTVGNCWFVAHAGSRAMTDPRSLKELFEETARHYVVHFPGDSVAVSKELPFHEGVPAFGAHDWTAKADRGLWLAVLEKAAAAREPGGYQALVGGQAFWAFDLTMATRPVQRHGGTPFDDALLALRRGHAPTIGMTPYESAKAGLPTVRMSVGQRQVLEGVGQWGNHYWIGTGVGSWKGQPTIEMLNSNLAKQPTRGMTRLEFDAVVTDLDTPRWYGSYMRTGINQDAVRALGLDATTPSFPTPLTDAERAAAALRARDGHLPAG